MLATLLVVLLVVGVLIVIPWLAAGMERSSGEGASGGNPFGIMEEIFHPAAHEASLVQMEAKEVVAQDPVPDDEEPGPRG